MPTIDAQSNAAATGRSGGYAQQEGGLRAGSDGITVLADGRIGPSTQEVLALIAEHRAVLATGHLSSREIVALVPEARRLRVERIVITHPDFATPNMALETLLELTRQGAIAEFTYLNVSPLWRLSTVEQMAAWIRALTPQRCLLASDGGQRHNPMPHEALRILAQSLFERGVAAADVYTMIKATPRSLLEP
jgi:hypothetical protein